MPGSNGMMHWPQPLYFVQSAVKLLVRFDTDNFRAAASENTTDGNGWNGAEPNGRVRVMFLSPGRDRMRMFHWAILLD